VKLDLGCGKNKREGFTGVDSRQFDGVDVVHDLSSIPWPWENDSVEEVHCSHFVEHLTAPQRIDFANELCRVLKKGAKAFVITPHWCSARAYGDMTHQWPPVSEWWFLYLNKAWRDANAPHNDRYTCDFDTVASSYSLHPLLLTRVGEVQQEKIMWAKEACQDTFTTIVKR